MLKFQIIHLLQLEFAEWNLLKHTKSVFSGGHKHNFNTIEKQQNP